MNKTEQVWVGLLGVVPKSGNNLLRGASGAYVNVLAWVRSASEYRSEIKRALSDHGLQLKTIKDVEPISERLKRYKVPNNILRLAKKTKGNRGVWFGEFYVYPDKSQRKKRQGRVSNR